MSSDNAFKEYRCDHYRCFAPEKHCLFCANCTGVFWDYTNGPYMFICEYGGNYLNCEHFVDDGKGGNDETVQS